MKFKRQNLKMASLAGNQLWLWMLGVLMCPVLLFGQKLDCSRILLEAEAKYQRQSYEEAEKLLFNYCLDKGIYDPATYRLLTLIYLDTDRGKDAKTRIHDLLEHAPGYRPDPKDRIDFVHLVAEVRLDRETLSFPRYAPEKGHKWWILGGSIAILTGGILAVLLSEG